MKSNLLLPFAFCFTLFAATHVYSQSVILSPRVISSAGGFSSHPGFSISRTTGELAAVKTVSGSSVILTQGFQQPDKKVLISNCVYATQSVFPNPANSEFSFQYRYCDKGTLYMAMFDILGQQVSLRRTEIYSGGEQTVQLPTENLSAGIYVLRYRFVPETGKEISDSKRVEVIH